MGINSNQAGINLTISKLQIVEISWKENEIVLENADEEFLPGFLDKNVNENELVEMMQRSYDHMLIRKQVSSKNVSFTLPTQMFSIVELPVDDLLTKDDLTNHLNWEFSQLYPNKNPDDFLLRYFEMGEYEIPNSKKILAAAVEKRILKGVHKFCISNNLQLRLIDNVHFASNLVISNAGSNDSYMSIYSDDNFFSLMIFDKGKPVYFGIFDDKDINLAVENIRMEYERFVSVQKQNINIKCIYAAGDSFSDSVIALFENYFKIHFEKMDPFKKLKTASTLFKNDLIIRSAHSFAAAAGIAARIS